MKDSKIPRQEIILLVGGWLALFLLQAIFRRPPFYDEDDYLGNVALLHQYGFSKNYLQHLVGSAGPLYSAVHFLFEPLTGLNAPYIRFVNTGFLVGVTYITYRILCILHFQNRFFALYTMAIPMTYVIGGLALTEIPAIFFFSLSVYLVIKSTHPLTGKNSILHLLFAGICTGLAILGRQPFLLTLVAFPILFVSKENHQKNIVRLGIFIVAALALPLYVFFIWKGLVPTIESQLYIDIAHAGISYRPDFFLLCIFYFAVSMLLIAPEFLKPFYGTHLLLKWGLAYIVVTALNFDFKWLQLLPAKPTLVKIMTNPGVIFVISSLCGSAVICLSIYFLLCIYRNLQHLKYQKELVFFTASLLLIAAACIKITWGFSSRYAAQALPLLVLTGSYAYKNSRYNLAGISIGILTGLLSLFSYFTGK